MIATFSDSLQLLSAFLMAHREFNFQGYSEVPSKPARYRAPPWLMIVLYDLSGRHICGRLESTYLSEWRKTIQEVTQGGQGGCTDTTILSGVLYKVKYNRADARIHNAGP